MKETRAAASAFTRLELDPNLLRRLAPLKLSEIDAMTDGEIYGLMGATPNQIADSEAAGDGWTWRESAKVSTDEWRDRLAADVAAGRAKVVTDQAEMRRRWERDQDEDGES